MYEQQHYAKCSTAEHVARKGNGNLEQILQTAPIFIDIWYMVYLNFAVNILYNKDLNSMSNIHLTCQGNFIRRGTNNSTIDELNSHRTHGAAEDLKLSHYETNRDTAEL